MVAAGSIQLADGTPANVAVFSFTNNTWSSVGDASQIPGPVTAFAVDNGNASSIFAAGMSVIYIDSVFCVRILNSSRSSQNAEPFLVFWNGKKWNNLGMGFDLSIYTLSYRCSQIPRSLTEPRFHSLL